MSGSSIRLLTFTDFAEHFIPLSISGYLSVLVLYFLYTRLTRKSEVPPGLPWVGKDPSKFFAETRAAISSFVNCRKWLAEGYEKVYYSWKSQRLFSFAVD